MTSLVNNWKPSDFHAVLLRLQERALLCRPNDAISFSLKYLEDEKAYSSSPEYCKIAHSLQYLPYLLKNSREFSSNLCITFIFILKSSKLLRPNNELMISIDELTDALNKYKAHEKWESVSFIDDVRLTFKYF